MEKGGVIIEPAVEVIFLFQTIALITLIPFLSFTQFNNLKGNAMTTKIFKIFVCVVILSLALPLQVFAQPQAAPAVPVTFTILHTNDFHGQLDNSLSTSNPGMARVATQVNSVRTAVGAANVLLVDAGDEMQGSLLSNLGDGTPTGKGIANH